MNTRVLSEILMSEKEYWIIVNEDYINRFGTSERVDDSIIFAAIPLGMKRGWEYEDITLRACEELYNKNLDGNVYLYPKYPPFQTGQTLSRVLYAYPVTGDVRLFLKRALELESKTLSDYLNLIEPDPIQP